MSEANVDIVGKTLWMIKEDAMNIIIVRLIIVPLTKWA